METLTTNWISRDISSTCSASGSALWASAKNIKPLVDANRHKETIELAYHKSPIRFSPIHYQNPGIEPPSPGGQTILFGCPLELRTMGELKWIPPILELLFFFVRNQHIDYPLSYQVRQKWRNCITTNSRHWKAETWWPLVNNLEQAWTGLIQHDRDYISKFVTRDHLGLILVCLPSYTIIVG